jgi:hypothetical protein
MTKRFFSRGFLRVLVYGSPVSLLILLIPSGDYRSWYDDGYGWPLFYGWRATDIRPRPLPRVDNLSAMLADWCVGAVVFVLLACVVRLWYLSRNSQPDAPPNGGPATRLGDLGVGSGPPSVS